MRSRSAVRAYRVRVIAEGHATGHGLRVIADDLGVSTTYVSKLARSLGLSFAGRNGARGLAIEAATMANRDAREPLPIAKHNRTGYTYWGCRCAACTAANTEGMRRWLEARKCL